MKCSEIITLTYLYCTDSFEGQWLFGKACQRGHQWLLALELLHETPGATAMFLIVLDPNLAGFQLRRDFEEWKAVKRCEEEVWHCGGWVKVTPFLLSSLQICALNGLLQCSSRVRACTDVPSWRKLDYETGMNRELTNSCNVKWRSNSGAESSWRLTSAFVVRWWLLVRWDVSGRQDGRTVFEKCTFGWMPWAER